MVRVFSVAYDEVLLRTRHLLLESRGYTVVSALTLAEALARAALPADILLLGYTINPQDRPAIVAAFRKANPSARVIALNRPFQQPAPEAEFHIDTSDPEELLQAIDRIVNPRAERRSKTDRG